MKCFVFEDYTLNRGDIGEVGSKIYQNINLMNGASLTWFVAPAILRPILSVLLII